MVFGWGNPSRGDDALGPLLLQTLRSGGDSGRWPGLDLRLVEDFQLQIEHALDLDGAELALFIDAGQGTPAPWALTELDGQAQPRFAASTHALSPQAVLSVYRQLQGRAPPPAFVLCVRGEQFALGAPLSAAARQHLAAAAALLQQLCDAPDARAWRARCTARLTLR